MADTNTDINAATVTIVNCQTDGDASSTKAPPVTTTVSADEQSCDIPPTTSSSIDIKNATPLTVLDSLYATLRARAESMFIANKKINATADKIAELSREVLERT